MLARVKVFFLLLLNAKYEQFSFSEHIYGLAIKNT